MKLRIEAPEHMHPFDIAQAILKPYNLLIKAENIKYSEKTFSRYKAMQQMSKELEAAYNAQLDIIVKRINEYASTNTFAKQQAIEQPIELKKANGQYIPLLSIEQIHAIQQIITDYHLAFVATQVGPQFIPQEALQRLIDIGVLPGDLTTSFKPAPGEIPAQARQAITEAYNYGTMIGRTPPMREQATTLTVDKFRQRKMPKLSPQETAARNWVNQHAAQNVRGLGNVVAADFSTIAIEADAELKNRYQKVITENIDMNLERRESWRKLASDLGHKTGDWSRGFQRIAATEKQGAMQEGLAAGLIEKEGDPETVFVAKIPNPDACKECIRLHLTAGPGSKPRIFTLSRLQSNGSNVGRKQADWKAVVGVIHPWCGCDLVHVPAGWEFDEDGNMKPKGLKRSEYLNHDLRKAEGNLTFKHVVPDRGCAVRVGDPVKVGLIDSVIAETPPEIFDKRVGVTLITVDHPRVQNPMDDHDLAYWTGNEIRLAIQLKPERLPYVLRHELAHGLNVYLMYQWGGSKPVRAWHKKLWNISKREGFVSEYAKLLPIENAAETTRLYLYERKRLMLHYPSTFAMLHNAYKGIWIKS